ncbi:MAG: tRNA pseudouridine(55) synthase TruB, partial [Treponema sp.]|nr:tRNA pseudouridine(55) synthase TruB [Treponema sp.]
EMKERPVTVHELKLLSWEPPFADIFVHCSSGTYIRSLSRDIALAAGSRAHLCGLVRTQISGFKLEEDNRGAADIKVQPIDKPVIKALGMPWLEVSTQEALYIYHGKPLAQILDFTSLPHCHTAAVFSGETLIAIIEKKDEMWKYGCVLPNC